MYSRKRKLSIALVLMVTMILAMVGCNKKPEAEPAPKEETTEAAPTAEETDEAAGEEAETEAASDDTITIAVAINDLDTFQKTQLAGYEDACKEKGYDFIYTNAGGNIEQQIADVESLMVQNPDVLGIQAIDSEALADVADKAYEQGIPVASIAFGLGTENCVSMGADIYIRGNVQGTNIAEYLEANPDVTLKAGYIWGSKSTAVGPLLHGAFLDGLEGYEDRFIILDEQDASWSQEEAMNITENWLQSYPEMNCIVAMSDPMVVGSLDALKGAGVDVSNWVAFGQDISQMAIPAMEEGYMVASVAMDIVQSSYDIIDAMADMAAGKVQNGDQLDFDVFTKITMDNLEENKHKIP